jgi:hypothetical protein
MALNTESAFASIVIVDLVILEQIVVKLDGVDEFWKYI